MDIIKKIFGILLLVLVIAGLFNPAFTLYLAVKLVELAIVWAVANAASRLIFKKSLMELFGL